MAYRTSAKPDVQDDRLIQCGALGTECNGGIGGSGRFGCSEGRRCGRQQVTAGAAVCSAERDDDPGRDQPDVKDDGHPDECHGAVRAARALVPVTTVPTGKVNDHHVNANGRCLRAVRIVTAAASTVHSSAKPNTGTP